MKVHSQPRLIQYYIPKVMQRLTLCLLILVALFIMPGCFSDNDSNNFNPNIDHSSSDQPNIEHDDDGDSTPPEDTDVQDIPQTDCVADNMDCAP